MNIKSTLVVMTLLLSFSSGFSSDIPIDSIVRKSIISGVSLSMDGKYIAAIVTENDDQGVLLSYNIETGKKKYLRLETGMDIYKYRWVSNDHLIYYVGKEKGLYMHVFCKIDRNFSKESKRVYNHAWGGTYVIDGLPGDPDYMLVRKRLSTKYSAIEKMHIHKGRKKKREKFKGVILWTETDFSGTLRLIKLYKKKHKKGEGDLYYRDSFESPWEKFDIGTKNVTYYEFTSDGKGLYISSYQAPNNLKPGPTDIGERKESVAEPNQQKKTGHVYYTYDPRAGEYTGLSHSNSLKDTGKTKSLCVYNIKKREYEKVIFSDPYYDFNGSLRFFGNPAHLASYSLKGIVHYNDTVETHWFDKKIAHIQNAIDSVIPNTVNVLYDADTSLTRFLFRSYSDTKMNEFYLYDVKSSHVTYLFKSCPWIKSDLMCEMKPVTFQTRDTLLLHGYLTLPRSGRAPYPTVILVHGGPHARDYWGFNGEVQVLASRGYAVFQINYRGSKGFGYTISQEEKFKFDKMHNDITDGAYYLINRGVADKKRIAVMGASFGGYLAICGVAFEPDLYCCAISNVGVFDWKKHLWLEKLSYNGYGHDYYYSKLGGGNNKAYLDSISPSNKVENIKVPVFLAAGSEDNVVESSQSVMLLSKLRRQGVPVEVYFKQYESHGFWNQKNITGYYTKVLDFLAKNMKKKENK